MNYLIYIGAFALLLLPTFYPRKFDFLSIILLFFLYFDCTIVFIQHPPTYIYFRNAVVLISSIYYFNKYLPKKRFNVIAFLLIIFLSPLILSNDLNSTTRIFSGNYASLILLPVSFHFYSIPGRIEKLFRSVFWFILFWSLFVVFATFLKIGGELSEKFGTTFYFGWLAINGGITYISFVLLTLPLVYNYMEKWKKIVLLICTVFIVIVFLAVLKRFVFFAILLGLVNYLLSKKVGVKYKRRLLISLVIISIPVMFSNSVKDIITTRYYERGAESNISADALEGDIRIYEPLYVFVELVQRPVLNILIGSRERAIIDIEHEGTEIKEREVHNEYAALALKYGLIGVLIYISIFFTLYRYTNNRKRYLVQFADYPWDLWIVFQNLLLIFVLEGMVGGHTHVTFRGFVFVFTGAIAGYLNYLSKSKKELQNE